MTLHHTSSCEDKAYHRLQHAQQLVDDIDTLSLTVINMDSRISELLEQLDEANQRIAQLEVELAGTKEVAS
jgi:peptidoglycan hydrolase CwlO-like protein